MIRSPEIQKLLDAFTQQVYGRTMKEPVCVICGCERIKYEDFRDVLSWKEFGISHMCQTCQDKTFEE